MNRKTRASISSMVSRASEMFFSVRYSVPHVIRSRMVQIFFGDAGELNTYFFPFDDRTFFDFVFTVFGDREFCFFFSTV